MAVTEQNNKDLSGMNTFRMSVNCRKFIEYDSISDLMDLDIEDLPQPVKHIGGGSNLLFTGDFKGTILHSKIDFIEPLDDSDDSDDSEEDFEEDFEDDSDKELSKESSDSELISVGSGVIFDDLCEWAATNGLWGIENLSDIPGEVGAAAVQNIGAYGVEFKDVVEAVYCWDLQECEFRIFPASECSYGYRQSIFKSPDYRNLIVTHVVIRLSRTASPQLSYGQLNSEVSSMPGYNPESPDPMSVRKAIIKIRSVKLPDPKAVGSAGSFFKNPVVTPAVFDKVKALIDHQEDIAKANRGVPHYIIPLVEQDGEMVEVSGHASDEAIEAALSSGQYMVKIPAAWLIEQCGWKGRRSGNAAVWDKQPLVLVNATGRAEPEEIIALENRVISSVKSNFGIILEPEVEHL